MPPVRVETRLAELERRLGRTRPAALAGDQCLWLSWTTNDELREAETIFEDAVYGPAAR